MVTADVPDPRFRDQLAEALRTSAHVCGWDVPCPCTDWADEQYDATVHATAVNAGHVNEVQGIPEAFADALLPTIAAEVEARVQAAANQRAAEMEGAVIRAAQLAQQWEINAQSSRDVGIAAVALVAAGQLRAALASPAPAPQAGEEGQ